LNRLYAAATKDVQTVPSRFIEFLKIPNAEERLKEALDVAQALTAAGVQLKVNLDHAAIFTDPPHLVAGPMKQLGYVSGWDARCYPSPVDGHDYINVSGQLPTHSPRRDEGWPDYIAVVHPVDVAARDHMLSQGYGNPFIHHLTWGIVAPSRQGVDDLAYADRLIRFMVETRIRIQEALHQNPGTLIIALPETVLDHPNFQRPSLPPSEFQVESMEGGGFLLQFFVLTGGRIELALRADTKQTFNPKSVYKISKDEISAVQT
jgi:hypothetical protein